MYTSLKFSKKLKEVGCELGSGWHWYEEEKLFHQMCVSLGGWDKKQLYPAYDILNDICVKYAKEFFRETYVACRRCNPPQIYAQPVLEIIYMLQQQKPLSEVEDYIWDNCKFKPKNK